MITYNDLELPSQTTTIKDILQGSDTFYSNSFTQGPTSYQDYFLTGSNSSNYIELTASKIYLPNAKNIRYIYIIDNMELGYFNSPLSISNKTKIIIANNFSSLSTSSFKGTYFLQYNVGRLYSTNSENIAAANAALSSNYQIFPTIELLPETRNDNEIPLDTLHNYTWEQILNADPEAAQPIIHIGDTKKLTFTDSNNNEQTLYIQIVGFNVDTLADDNTKTAKISWLSIPSLSDYYASGYGNYINNDNGRYNYYNNNYERFDTVIKNKIVSVKKNIYTFSNTGSNATISNTTAENLLFWFPSLQEFQGSDPIYNKKTLGDRPFWSRDIKGNQYCYISSNGIYLSNSYCPYRIGFCTN